jgi:hypothetical protein
MVFLEFLVQGASCSIFGSRIEASFGLAVKATKIGYEFKGCLISSDFPSLASCTAILFNTKKGFGVHG